MKVFYVGETVYDINTGKKGTLVANDNSNFFVHFENDNHLIICSEEDLSGQPGTVAPQKTEPGTKDSDVNCKTCNVALQYNSNFNKYPYCTTGCALKDGIDGWGNPITSARYNEGKVQTREVDPAFILGIGEVLTKSRAKYDHFNWCKPTKLSTPYESMMRHIMAFQQGEELDKETQSHHLLHAATNLMFMYYHITNNPEESDDRFFKKDKK